MENISQNEQIRLHLEAGNTITPLEALNKFGCLRLGAIIHNLKAMGLAIHSRLVGDNGKHYSEYSLPASELHARDRYAVAEGMKTLGMLLIVATLTVSCATQAPRSASLHRAVDFRQETAQYQARRSAGKDPGRMYRNWDRRPHRMTRIPLTNFYIF